MAVNYVSDVNIGAGELYYPYRDLKNLIDRSLTDASSELLDELEDTLKRHKPDFLKLFNIKDKNVQDREELKKACMGVEGIFLKGFEREGRQVLPQSLVREAILISDIFEINEFLALDLLVLAESEQESFPGWGRGLIAVNLFYEGRVELLSSLLTLIQALSGNTWNSRVPAQTLQLFDAFLSNVLKEELMDVILVTIDTKTNLKAQIEKLDANLALGDWRHRSQVTKNMNLIREHLGNIIFCWAAQKGLLWPDTLRLLEYLRSRVRPQDEGFIIGKEHVFMICAIFYAIDANIAYPNFNKDYLIQLRNFCSECEKNSNFACEEILELFKLTYYTSVYKSLGETHLKENYQATSILIRDDEDFEFKKDMFAFLKNHIFQRPELVSEEEHVARRFHTMFADLISFAPLKLKEMKSRSEDSAKTALIYQEQGITRPLQLLQEYENFLEALGLFYSLDSFELAQDFFSLDTRFALLNKLVRVSSVDPPTMFVPNVKMLTGLARSFPKGVFNLVKQNGHNLSMNHFFDSVVKYLSSYGNISSFDGPSLYHSEAFVQVVSDSSKLLVSPSEIRGICAYLDLITVLASNCEDVKRYFTTNKSQWVKVCLSVSKVRALPRIIRAKMLETAAAVISIDSASPESVVAIWDVFYTSKLVDQHTSDIRAELEEKESRDEQYMLTIGFLKFLNSLVDIRFAPQEQAVLEVDVNSVIDGGNFDQYIAYIRDSVLLKASYRSYKNLKERWEMSTIAVSILSKLLDFIPGLMIQLLSDSPFFRTILNILVDCFRVREMTTGPIPDVDKCSWHCLNLIQRALQRQHAYFHRKEASIRRFNSVIVGIHELILRVSPETGRKEYLLAILKFVDLIIPERHRTAALEIIASVLTGHSELDSHLYTTVASDVQLGPIVRHTISTSLDPSIDENLRRVVLKLLRVSIVHPSPNLALFLLGVEKKIEFENPGVGDYPRTILHAILENSGNLRDAFLTILVLVRDPRLSKNLLKYLRTNQFYIKFLRNNFPPPNMSQESIGHFLKCIAIELKTSLPGPLFNALVGVESSKFIQILEDIDMEVEPLFIPHLDFFDPDEVTSTLKKCEYYDRELKTRFVRVELFETILRDEISKLEKTSAFRLRSSINEEAKDLILYTRNLNQNRQREASKVLVFDGWRQCLEVLTLSINSQSVTNIEFVSNIARILIDKIVNATKPCEVFLRLCSETTLVLCSVIGNISKEVTGMTLNGVLGGICKWTRCDQTPFIRAHLYGSILFLLNRMRSMEEARPKGAYFALVMDNICKDTSQTHEVSRIQALTLLSEIFRWLTHRGLGGLDMTRIPELDTTIVHDTTVHPKETFNEFDSILNSRKANYTLNTTMNKSKRMEKSRTVSPYVTHSDNLNFFHSKGLLKGLVESLINDDDPSLIEVFSDNPNAGHFKSLLVFEAKMGLLSRFARVGLKATSLLIDSGLLLRLQDMSAFNINFVEEEVIAAAGRPGLGNNQRAYFLPPRIKRVEILFGAVFKLFHSMLDSASKNFLLVYQIWNFLKAFNNSVVSLLSTQKDFFPLLNLFTALMARLGRKLPYHIVTASDVTFMPKLLSILRTQALCPEFNATRIKIVRNVIQYLFNHSTNIEVEREQKKKKRPWPCRFVLNPAVVEPLLPCPGTSDDLLSLGAVLKIVRDVAQQLKGNDARMRMDSLAIIQIGLVISYYHVDIYLRDVQVNPEHQKEEQKRFQSELRTLTEDSFVKAVLEAVKNPATSHSDFIETILYKIRRLAHLPC